MQVGARPVEQADDGGVDVPHLVGSRGSKAHLRLRRMHAEPRVAPAELPHEAAPGRGGGPDLTEPLRQDAERAGRTCRYLSAVTMSLIARTSGAVSRWGDVRGQDD